MITPLISLCTHYNYVEFPKILRSSTWRTKILASYRVFSIYCMIPRLRTFLNSGLLICIKTCHSWIGPISGTSLEVRFVLTAHCINKIMATDFEYPQWVITSTLHGLASWSSIFWRWSTISTWLNNCSAAFGT